MDQHQFEQLMSALAALTKVIERVDRTLKDGQAAERRKDRAVAQSMARASR